MKRKSIAPGPGLMRGLSDLRTNPANVTASITSIIFGVTGAFVLFANIASSAGLTTSQTVSWIMAGNIVSCLATIFLSLFYRQPIVIMPSLTALLIMGSMFTQYSLNEIVAGYIMSAAIVTLVGMLGIIGTIERLLPLPIVMAMVAGTFIPFAQKMVNGVVAQPLAGGIIVGGFLLAHLFFRRIPPLLIAVICGILCCVFLIPIQVDPSSVGFGHPVFYVPSFRPSVFVSVTIPLVLIILSGFWRANGILRANGYDAPLNSIVTISGIISILGGFFMGHAANTAGPMIAIVGGKDAGKREDRYTASVLGTAGLLMAGVFSGFILPYVCALPTAISDIFAGLALIGLFTNSLEIAFGSKQFQKGAFTAFIVGMSGFSGFGIGTPVWALVFGMIVSLLTERTSFAEMRTQSL